jgi:molybdopterin/thiamine biosynthesis adenylyltransferase
MLSDLRHKPIFDHDQFRDHIDIIGCGSAGSKIAYSLAKLGIENQTLWDFDAVEPHNLSNQLFGIDQINQAKSSALRDIIKRDTGYEVEARTEKVVDQELSGVIFLMVDSMSARKEIFENCLKFKPAVKHFFEVRMGADVLRVYNANPCDIRCINGWEKTLCNDDEVQVSVCGSSISVGPTSDVLAGVAVWQFIQWFSHICKPEKNPLPEDGVIFGLNPFSSINISF